MEAESRMDADEEVALSEDEDFRPKPTSQTAILPAVHGERGLLSHQSLLHRARRAVRQPVQVYPLPSLDSRTG